jgi:hypothetical protein
MRQDGKTRIARRVVKNGKTMAQWQDTHCRVVNMGIAAWRMRPFLTSPTTIREISVVP